MIVTTLPHWSAVAKWVVIGDCAAGWGFQTPGNEASTAERFQRSGGKPLNLSAEMLDRISSA